MNENELIFTESAFEAIQIVKEHINEGFIDNNKRILNSANDESLVEVLLENNADN